MIDITIQEKGPISVKNRRNLIDFLLRTDKGQEWTTLSTENNVYMRPGDECELLPNFEDRCRLRQDLIMDMKNIDNENIGCDKYLITIWKKGPKEHNADILKTAIYEIREAFGEPHFFKNSFCFILHTESNLKFALYRLKKCDNLGIEHKYMEEPVVESEPEILANHEDTLDEIII